MDFNKEIKKLMSTGKVKMGLREAKKSDGVQMYIVAKNCTDAEYFKNTDIPVYYYEGDGKALGVVCGKPFNISVITVIDAGSSGILSAITERNT